MINIGNDFIIILICNNIFFDIVNDEWCFARKTV